ncbi:lysophospholipid acyltransferase family protein [Corynebacterium sp. NPDC060344]|uniref:lysophospholipid acyltransferase family protein n=1 Tax=Corynebacterium sp. NPDC060344 TaxID=3347101 RepID=UPI0036590D9E
MIPEPDLEFVEGTWFPALAQLHDHWFRVDVHGGERIPADGPVMVVANHSGNLPIDAIMAQLSLHRASGRLLRFLAGDVAFSLPVVSELATKVGAVRASRDAAGALLGAGEMVGVFPEGYRGLGKPYTQRYQLQAFGRGGFAAAALRHGAPIVPVAITGAEEIYPQLGSVLRGSALLGAEGMKASNIGHAEGAAPVDEALESLVMGMADVLAQGASTPLKDLPAWALGADGAADRRALVELVRDVVLSIARGLGIPYVPTTPFFPWLGVAGAVPLPSKWRIDVLDPIDPRDWAESYRAGFMEPPEAGPGTGASPGIALDDDPVSILGLSDEVKQRIQATLLRNLRNRKSAFY